MDLLIPDFPFSLYLVIPFLVIGIPLIPFLLSRLGWKTLAARYELMRPFDGDRIGIISAKINGANYNNVLLTKRSHEGLYMRPILIFRLFHPPLFIPWTEISDIREEKTRLSRMTVLSVGRPTTTTITLAASTFRKLSPFLEPDNRDRPGPSV